MYGAARFGLAAMLMPRPWNEYDWNWKPRFPR